MKKILYMFPIIIALLYGCNAKEQSNLDTKEANLSQSRENFHKNIDKDLFQIVNVKDLILGDYLNKKVAIKGKVYTYIIDDYKNFKFSISDSTGEVKCFWYSIDRQESSKMFNNLEFAQMQSAIADNYYNVIVYGEYQNDPKNVGEKNIFVYDIEFVDVELGSDGTLGGIPIWSNHDIDIEDDSNITESSNDSFNLPYFSDEDISAYRELYPYVMKVLDENNFKDVNDIYEEHFLNVQYENDDLDLYFDYRLSNDYTSNFVSLELSICSDNIKDEFKSEDYKILQDIVDILHISNFSIEPNMDVHKSTINFHNDWFLDYTSIRPTEEEVKERNMCHSRVMYLEFKKRL